MQLHSQISQGSSGSPNSTFFKTPLCDDVALSVSNTTDDSGLFSALTRFEEKELNSIKTRILSAEGDPETPSNLHLCNEDDQRTTKTLREKNSANERKATEVTIEMVNPAPRTVISKETRQDLIRNMKLSLGNYAAVHHNKNEESGENSSNCVNNKWCTREMFDDIRKFRKFRLGELAASFYKNIDCCSSSGIANIVDGMNQVEKNIVNYCEPTSLKASSRQTSFSSNPTEPTREMSEKMKYNASSRFDNGYDHRIEHQALKSVTYPSIRREISDDESSNRSLLEIFPHCCESEKLLASEDESFSLEKCCSLDDSIKPSPVAVRKTYFYPSSDIPPPRIAPKVTNLEEKRVIPQDRPFEILPAKNIYKYYANGIESTGEEVFLSKGNPENMVLNPSIEPTPDTSNSEQKVCSSYDKPTLSQETKLSKQTKTNKTKARSSQVNQNKKLTRQFVRKKKVISIRRSTSQLGDVNTFSWKRKIYS